METERTGPILMDEGAPEFPPLLKGHAILAGHSAFSQAVEAAKHARAGAGDFFWGVDNRYLDVAIILEPDVPAQKARQMLFVLMVAFGDSFGALAPAELGLYYRWPGHFILDGGHIGSASMAMSQAGADDIPDTMVVGLNVELTPDPGGVDPGMTPDKTTLWDEGCGDITQTELIESLSRHFLTWVNNWQEDGFKPVHESWEGRARGFSKAYDLTWDGHDVRGEFLSLDEDGNLFLKTSAGPRQLHLEPMIGYY